MRKPIELLITILWIALCSYLLWLHYQASQARLEQLYQEAIPDSLFVNLLNQPL